MFDYINYNYKAKMGPYRTGPIRALSNLNPPININTISNENLIKFYSKLNSYEPEDKGGLLKVNDPKNHHFISITRDFTNTNTIDTYLLIL